MLDHRFDAARALELIERHRVTFTTGAITVFIALMDAPEAGERDTSSLRTIVSGGAPIAPATVEAFEERFGTYIHNIYGLTETTSPSHCVPMGTRAPVDPTSGALSVGVPIYGTVVRVVGEDGRDLPAGEVGEIVTSGPQVVPGYWGRPEESERAIPGGALHTGDVGFMDADGWFYVVDRKKDQINAAGYKVWPREVEDVLYGHPAVREAAVVGVPDAYRGETVKAFVSLRPGARVDADELIAFCRERMAAYKYPRVVELVDELPEDGERQGPAPRAARPLGSTRVMPDVYASIATADEAVQERLAEVLELRAADVAQQAMLEDYLADLPLADGARVLEVGCGTGAVARSLAVRPGVGEVVGLDPSPVFVQHAQEIAAGVDNLAFVVGGGTALPFDDGAFDAVIFHTVLSHIPQAGTALAEAARVTAAGGALAAFDGDYATTTVAVGDHDPLQACVDAALDALVHDRYLVRRLGTLVRAAGWEVVRLRSHGYIESEDPGYMLTIVDRGADTLVAAGRLGSDAADALKAEARRRVAAGEFFGHIAYASLIGRRS